MAITPFGKGRETESANAPRTTSAAPSTGSSAGGLTAFIDQGSEFEGKLSFRDTVRIDGKFCGEITSENTLIVGESGEIEATILSNTIAVSGHVTGNVVAKTKVVPARLAVSQVPEPEPEIELAISPCLNPGSPRAFAKS